MKNEANNLPSHQRSGFTTKDMALTAMFAVLIAVCSWISIPTQVPFTLQTFAIFCALGILGGKRGFFATLVYVLLGTVGIPVFSGFSGGIGVLLGSTGGYIIGFILSAGTYWLAEKLFGDKLIIRIISMVIGLVLCLSFGTIWFMVVYGRTVDKIDLITALKWCVIPFLLWDGIKLALSLVVSEAVKKRVRV